MLALRRRGHGQAGAGGGEPPVIPANAVVSWGSVQYGKNGEGWIGGEVFPFPRAWVNLTGVVQIATASSVALALDYEGRAYVAGNGETGVGGVGYNTSPGYKVKAGVFSLPSGEVVDPTLIPGGLPLFNAEVLKTGKPKKLWAQPQGPNGPVLYTRKQVEEEGAPYYATAVGVGASHGGLLTSNGQAMTWGSPVFGDLGNGLENIAATASMAAWGQIERGDDYGTGVFTAGSTTVTKATGAENGSIWKVGERISIYPSAKGVNELTAGTVITAVSGAKGNQTLTLDKPAPAGISGTYEVFSEGGRGWPQFAPFWVLTGPGPATALNPSGAQSAYPDFSNCLKNIRAMDLCERVSYYLLNDGNVAYCGQPAGNSKREPGGLQVYAGVDPLWAEYLDPANKPIALKATKQAYLLLLEDGTSRFVGNNKEFAAGNGDWKSAKTNMREVLTPGTSAGVPARKITAIGKGEYGIKVLKDNGVAYAAGSNVDYNTGRNAPTNVPNKYLTAIPALNAGGRKVIALAEYGETGHGYMDTEEGGELPGRPEGANNGDMAVFLLDDKTIRTLGPNWNFNPGKPWVPRGTLGTGNLEHPGTPDASGYPVQPLGLLNDPHLTNVTSIEAGNVMCMALVEPAVPATPTLSAVSNAVGEITVSWHVPLAPTGPSGYAMVRAPSDFNVQLKGESLNPLSPTNYVSSSAIYKPGSGASGSHTFTGLVSGATYLASVSELPSNPEAKPAITGGATKRATNRQLHIDFAAPPVGQEEPGFIYEFQRLETYTPGTEYPLTELAPITATIYEAEWPEENPKPKSVVVTSPLGVKTTLTKKATKSEMVAGSWCYIAHEEEPGQILVWLPGGAEPEGWTITVGGSGSITPITEKPTHVQPEGKGTDRSFDLTLTALNHYPDTVLGPWTKTSGSKYSTAWPAGAAWPPESLQVNGVWLTKKSNEAEMVAGTWWAGEVAGVKTVVVWLAPEAEAGIWGAGIWGLLHWSSPTSPTGKTITANRGEEVLINVEGGWRGWWKHRSRKVVCK